MGTLPQVERPERSCLLFQLITRVALGNAPIHQHHNAVRLANRAIAMGDEAASRRNQSREQLDQRTLLPTPLVPTSAVKPGVKVEVISSSVVFWASGKA